MQVPSFDIWDRTEFLHARWAQYEDEKKRIMASDDESGVFLAEPDHHIICDICCAEIRSQTVNVVNFGSKVACPPCFTRHYAGQPLRYKEVPNAAR